MFAQRVVDRRDHALDEADERRHRLVLERDVPLEREVGRVDLQHEARADDRLVFDPQRLAERLQIFQVGVVVLVLDRRGDDAGRGRVHEGLDESVRMLLRGHRAKSRHSASIAAGIDVAHLADRHRQAFVRRHARLGSTVCSSQRCLNSG